MPRYLVQIVPSQLDAVQAQLRALKAPAVSRVFDYIVVSMSPELAEKLKSVPGVVSVTLDKPVSATRVLIPVDKKLSQFQRLFMSNPFTGPALAFKFIAESDSGKVRVPTSLSRKMVGAEEAENEGITGKGVKVAVLDTGTDVFGVQGPYLGGKSSVEGQLFQADENGHGCVTGDSIVFTNFCGIETMETLFNRTKAMWGSTLQEDGIETIQVPPGMADTIGWDQETCVAPVSAIHKIPYRGPLVHVHLTDRTCYETTPWHLFLTQDIRSKRYVYRRADTIKASRNYCLVTPQTAASIGKTQIVTYTQEKRHWAWAKPRVQEHSVQLTEELAYLSGLIVGDGHLWSGRGTGQVQLSIGDSPPEPIISLLRELDFPAYTSTDKRGKAGNVTIHIGVRCYRIMCSLGIPNGKKAFIVGVPELVSKSPPGVRLAFLAGLIDSDGSFEKAGGLFRYVTISERLAYGLCALLSTLGIRGRLSVHSPGRPSGKIVGKHPVWIVSVSGIPLQRMVQGVSPYLRLRFPPRVTSVKGKHTWIARTKRVDFDGFLYDLTTTTENYLCGKGALTFIHNTHVQTTISGRPFQSIHGLLKGVAVDAEVAAFKVLGYGLGAGTTSSVLRGIADAVEWGADIVSMSLGGPEAGPDDPENRIISALTKQGMIFVIAAGNDGPNPQTIGTPGDGPDSLTVGAIDINGEIASFSSRGPTKDGRTKPDVVAPGVDILSTSAGLIATMQVMDGPPKLAAISGTSMATPHVSGVVALALEYARSKGKTLTTDMIKQAMAKNGDFPEKSLDFGYGLITYPRLKAYIDSL